MTGTRRKGHGPRPALAVGEPHERAEGQQRCHCPARKTVPCVMALPLRGLTPQDTAVCSCPGDGNPPKLGCTFLYLPQEGACFTLIGGEGSHMPVKAGSRVGVEVSHTVCTWQVALLADTSSWDRFPRSHFTRTTTPGHTCHHCECPNPTEGVGPQSSVWPSEGQGCVLTSALTRCRDPVSSGAKPPYVTGVPREGHRRCSHHQPVPRAVPKCA